MERFDVVVLGAGAAGLMCAIQAGRRRRRVLVIDHAATPGEKIRISGGGRCNFTNLHTGPNAFLSRNPRFAISALSRYTPADFIALVEQHGIAWHEKSLGQLFCDDSARQIVAMLIAEMRGAGAELRLGTSVTAVEPGAGGFTLATTGEPIVCASLVVATGGKSIPKMGATGFAYDLARQFGLGVVETRPALVPLRLDPTQLESLSPLVGVATRARARHGKTAFDEGLLFTHRGLSGPAILQISSYWREGESIEIDFVPGVDVYDLLRRERAARGRRAPQSALSAVMPQRLADHIVRSLGIAGNLADMPDAALRRLAEAANLWRIKPVGSEGYRTAEVTLGGVDTADLNSRDMSAKAVPSLYFIGEAVDVTGWLGGYNFQWAWSSGWCAGQAA